MFLGSANMTNVMFRVQDMGQAGEKNKPQNRARAERKEGYLQDQSNGQIHLMVKPDC